MAKQKFGYGWVIKWVLAAILIAAGILMKIYDEEIVYATTGLAIVIFSLLRVVPLMKTLKKEVLRTINLIEIIFDTILGGLMLFVVFSGKLDVAGSIWVGLYGYMLTFFFLVRGIIYFVSLYYFEEKTEAIKFWFHLICIALGPVILTLTILDKDIITTLGWMILFIAIGGGGYLGYDGFGGYKKYREKSKALNSKKQAEAKPIVEKEVPQPIRDEVEEKETYVN
ncbi:hypothetical protein RJI07_05095 [Mycoplasmatota bacterium WC30]